DPVGSGEPASARIALTASAQEPKEVSSAWAPREAIQRWPSRNRKQHGPRGGRPPQFMGSVGDGGSTRRRGQTRQWRAPGCSGAVTRQPRERKNATASSMLFIARLLPRLLSPVGSRRTLAPSP